MIDTIGVKIDIEPSDFKKFYEVHTGSYVEDYDDETGDLNRVKLRKSLKIGSWERGYSIHLTPLTLYLEFSIPKVIYNNNVRLVEEEWEIKRALEKAREAITKKYNVELSPYMDWKVVRLDLCFAWKHLSEQSAIDRVNMLSNLTFKSFGYEYHKDESVIWKSKSKAYSMEFYCKRPEYLVHEHNKLIKNGFNELAYFLNEVSKGVLRFEVKLRNREIERRWGTLQVKRMLSLDKYTVLQSYLSKITKLTGDMYEDLQIQKALNDKYGSTRAVQLFLFYKVYFDEISTNRKYLINTYNRRTIWRNLRDIKNAGVGLPYVEESGDFPLDIPSNFNINNEFRLSTEVQAELLSQNLLF